MSCCNRCVRRDGHATSLLDQIGFPAGQQTEYLIGEHDIDFVRDCLDESVEELFGSGCVGLVDQLGKGDLRGPIGRNEQI